MICRASPSRPTTGRNSRLRPRPHRNAWCSPAMGDFIPSTRRSCRVAAVLASAKGRGFVVAEDECLANTRKGKQVLNVAPPDAARAVATVTGELVASIGENRKMLIFALDQVPEMAR